MHSSLSRVKLPSIEDIERFHGDGEGEQEAQQVDVEELIRKANRERDKIINAAQEEAIRTMEQAKVDAAKLKESQSNLGYIEGKKKAEVEIAALIERQKTEFHGEVEALSSYREQMFEAVKQNVIECIGILCRKIIFQKFDESDEVMADMIDHYYAIVKERSELVLRVSQEDHDKLDMSAMERRGLVVKIDETFSHGDMMISCEAESINFSLEHQLEKIDETLGVDEA